MTRRGRKPLALDHISHLDGSEHAKQRMTILLRTLQADCDVAEACDGMQLSESQFHTIRHQWLQRSLQLLEPRTPGRPRKQRGPESERVEQLEREVRDLQRELALTRARCEVLEAFNATAPDAVKKGSTPC